MIRVTRIGGKWYGCELPSDEEDAMVEILTFARDGIPVVVIEDLQDMGDLDIYEDIEMVERGGE